MENNKMRHFIAPEFDMTKLDPKGAFDYFLAFLRHKIDLGTKQVDIAKSEYVAVRPEYISRIYKGHQQCSLEKQEGIAKFFGVSYQEMLRMGQQIYEGIQSLTKEALAPVTPTSALWRTETGQHPPDSHQKQPHNLSASQIAREIELAAEDFTPEDIVSLFTTIVAARGVTITTLQDNLVKAEKENLRWTALIETLLEPLSIIGKDNTFVYQNRKSIELFGQYLGAHIDEAYKTLAPYDNSKLKEVFMTGLAHHKQEWQQDKFMEVTYLPLFDVGGGVERIALIGRDITDERIRRGKREDDLARFSGIFESALMGLVLIDENGDVVITNEAFKSLTQLETPPETFNDLLDTAMSTQNATDVAARLISSFKNMTPSEGLWIMSDGKKLWQDTRPLLNDNKFVGIIIRLFDYDEESSTRRFFRRKS